MGDPRLGVDGAILDQFDDAREVAGQRVAAGADVQLAAMERGRVGETDLILGDADVNEPSAKGAVIQRLGHGLVAARGVHHHIGELAVGQFAEPLYFLAVAPRENGVGHAHLLTHEGETLFVHVHDDSLGAGEPREFHGGQANRPGPDDEDVLAGLRLAAIHRMTPDGQGLHEGELIEGQFSGDVQLARGQNESFAQAAIAHHAEGLVGLATVGVAAPAGVAMAAVDVWLHGAAVAGLHIHDARADRQHFNPQLVAWNARVAEEGHLAEKPGEVGAANTDAMDPQQRLAGTGRSRFGDLHRAEVLRLFELNRFHDFTAQSRQHIWSQINSAEAVQLIALRPPLPRRPEFVDAAPK